MALHSCFYSFLISYRSKLFEHAQRSARPAGPTRRIRSAMSPKKSGAAKAAAKAAGKSKAKAAPSRAMAAAAVSNAAPLPQINLERAAMNAEYYAKFAEDLKAILEHDFFQNIQNAEPLPITRETQDVIGHGFTHPFDLQVCQDAMATAGQYQAGGNLFWADVQSSPTKGVPLRLPTTLQLAEFLYPQGETPTYFEDHISVQVKTREVDRSKFGQYCLITAEEHVHATIFACARDIKNGASEELLNAWRQLFLTVSFRFVHCDDDKCFFMAKTLRNTVAQNWTSLGRTAFQEICEVATMKAKWEEDQGTELTSHDLCVMYKEKSKRAECQEEITFSFIDSACTIWARALSIPEVLDAVRYLDDRFSHKSVFDSVTKLQTLISKAKDPDAISWTFVAIKDGFVHGLLAKDGIGLRELQGYGTGQHGKGIVDEILYKREVLAWMKTEWLTGMRAY